MPRLPWAGLSQAVGLKFLHLPAHRIAGKLPLQRIPEREARLALVAFRIGLLLFGDQLVHEHLRIALRRVALRAEEKVEVCARLGHLKFSSRGIYLPEQRDLPAVAFMVWNATEQLIFRY